MQKIRNPALFSTLLLVLLIPLTLNSLSQTLALTLLLATTLILLLSLQTQKIEKKKIKKEKIPQQPVNKLIRIGLEKQKIKKRINA